MSYWRYPYPSGIPENHPERFPRRYQPTQVWRRKVVERFAKNQEEILKTHGDKPTMMMKHSDKGVYLIMGLGFTWLLGQSLYNAYRMANINSSQMKHPSEL